MECTKLGKGQGSLEYMATYGWVIAVVLLVGVVIWQMGIFSPSEMTPKGSSGFGQVRPLDWKCLSSTSGVQVEWVSAAGEKIIVEATNGGCTYQEEVFNEGVLFNISEMGSLVCNYESLDGCSGTLVGDRFESVVTLAWRAASGGPAHTESGRVWGAAE